MFGVGFGDETFGEHSEDLGSGQQRLSTRNWAKNGQEIVAPKPNNSCFRRKPFVRAIVCFEEISVMKGDRGDS
jgi:hypothetical protein